ncbi:hypothetical protein IID19_00320 [Patescibacteria group bacterium]|nr:hypothetical protein [Patescibacteria group bacterium]
MNIQWLKNIIEKINLNISSSRINSPNYKSKTIIKSSGLKPEEAKQLITDVLNSNTIIAGLKSIAEQTYNERFIDFKNEIKSRISNLDKTELLKLADPSTHVLLIEA